MVIGQNNTVFSNIIHSNEHLKRSPRAQRSLNGYFFSDFCEPDFVDWWTERTETARINRFINARRYRREHIRKKVFRSTTIVLPKKLTANYKNTKHRSIAKKVKRTAKKTQRRSSLKRKIQAPNRYKDSEF